MSDAIVGRIDEMGGRIDELEKSIESLMNQVYVYNCISNQRIPRQSKQTARHHRINKNKKRLYTSTRFTFPH